MAKGITELKKAVSARNIELYDGMLREIPDRCIGRDVVWRLIDYFKESLPDQNLSEAMEYLIKSNWHTSNGNLNDYAYLYPSAGELKNQNDMAIWLYFCCGKMKLEDVFHDLLAKISDNPDYEDGPKTVFVFSDKWSNSVFKKEEIKFLEKAKSRRINFFFIVATDYGFYQVPFLPVNCDSQVLVEYFR